MSRSKANRFASNIYLFIFFFMITANSQSPRELNLTAQNTSEAMQSASLCEKIRIRVEKIGNSGIFTIPVRKIRSKKPKVNLLDITDAELSTLLGVVLSYNQ